MTAEKEEGGDLNSTGQGQGPGQHRTGAICSWHTGTELPVSVCSHQHAQEQTLAQQPWPCLTLAVATPRAPHTAPVELPSF